MQGAQGVVCLLDTVLHTRAELVLRRLPGPRRQAREQARAHCRAGLVVWNVADILLDAIRVVLPHSVAKARAIGRRATLQFQIAARVIELRHLCSAFLAAFLDAAALRKDGERLPCLHDLPAGALHGRADVFTERCAAGLAVRERPGRADLRFNEGDGWHYTPPCSIMGWPGWLLPKKFIKLPPCPPAAIRVAPLTRFPNADR